MTSVIQSVFSSRNKLFISQQEYYDFLSKRMRLIALLISIVTCTIFAATHEYWVDEYQSWAIAKEVPLWNLFSVIPTEGHPVLYHAFLKLFVYSMPTALMPWTSWLLYGIAQIFLYRTPMIRTEVYTIMSTLILIPYWIGAFARSYTLCYLFIALLLYGYNYRFRYKIAYSLIIALAMSVHFQFTVTMFCFGFVYGIELIYLIIREIKEQGLARGMLNTRTHVIAGFILLLGVGIALLQFSLIDTTHGSNFSNYSIAMVFRYLSKAIMGYPWVSTSGLSVLVGLIVILVCFLTIIVHSFNIKTSGIAVLLTFAGNMAVLLKANLTTHQKVMLFLFSLFLCCYISPVFERVTQDKRNTHRFACSLLICGMLFSQNICSLRRCYVDLTSDFYGETLVANKLEQLCDKNIPILFTNFGLQGAIAPRMAEDGYNVIIGDTTGDNTYAIWGTSTVVTDGELFDAVLTGEASMTTFLDVYTEWRGIEKGTRLYIVLPMLYTGYSHNVMSQTDELTRNALAQSEVDTLTRMDAKYMESIGIKALVDWEFTYGYYGQRGVAIEYVTGSGEEWNG